MAIKFPAGLCCVMHPDHVCKFCKKAICSYHWDLLFKENPQYKQSPCTDRPRSSNDDNCYIYEVNSFGHWF